MFAQALASSDAGAGINRYWDYEERPIPGIGKAMVNVGTGNLVLQATDFDIPERGLGLVMQRTYNSQSLHDANGDDGSEQAIFGNGWTNTYDAHLVFRSNGDISVYDIDGTRCDYSADGHGGWKACPGEHATLEVDPNIPCSYWLVKKSGTAYWFDTPIPSGCFIPQGNIGRLYKIVGRNSNNSITLSYAFAQGQPQTAENITEIDVNHSNGQSLKMTFGQADGSGPNELTQIALPDGGKVNYAYDLQGDLQEVDRTDGNDAAAVLPETYGIQHPIQFACGPRATISNQGDGACLHFDYDSNVNLIDWKVNGILNFDPGDGFGKLQPITTSWQTWYTANFVYGSGSNTPCGNTNANTTTMCDVDGHSIIWRINAASQVTRRQVFTGPSSSLVTTQSFDPNTYDLLSTTDPRGNETDYGYDLNGNTVEELQPTVQTSQGQIRPMSLYSYDSNNNIVAYCDPVANVNRTPPTQMTDSLCPTTSGAGSFLYRYTTSQAEPFGELTDIRTPCFGGSCPDGGNEIQISYSAASQGGGVDYGLPTTVQGRQYVQEDNTTRSPEQDFTYDVVGNLTSYRTGPTGQNSGDGTWTMVYSLDNMNRVVKRTDPDGNTSHMCYQPDGSVYYTETAYQYALDGGGFCSTASPAPASVFFGHDTDGNVTQETHHHGGSYEASFPNPSATPNISSTSGTTRKYYDGEDRLVEVQAPQDGNSDVFSNRWTTRYLYDLTQSDGAATLSFQGKSGNFAAYGNLYDTEELLPSSTNDFLTWGGYQGSVNATPAPAPTPIVNSTFADINATAFDAADRPTAEYRIVYKNSAENLATEALTYDNNSNTIGLLTSDCQTSVSECTNYTYDRIARVTVDQFTKNGSVAQNTPERDQTYDPDGRTAQITEQPTQQQPIVDNETYSYDLDGRLLEVAQPASHTMLFSYYYDGKRRSLGGAPLGADTFDYSYAPDGTIQQLNFGLAGAHSGKQVYTLTAAGRVTKRDDYVDHSAAMTTLLTYSKGLLTEEDFPCGNCGVGQPQGSHAAMGYSAEGELLGRLVTAPWSFTVPGQHSVAQYAQTWYYNKRGEVVATFDPTNHETDTRYANGVQIIAFPKPSSPTVFTGRQAQWDARMGAASTSAYSASLQSLGKTTVMGQTSTISYDSAGRNTGSAYAAFCSYSVYPFTCSNNPISEGTTRSYDVENHIINSSATYTTQTGVIQPLASDYVWGANGHPWRIGSTPSGGQPGDDTVYWDGGSPVYSTNSNGQIDDIKIGSMGEYTPKDTGYSMGITFYDRGVDGSVAFCHNVTGGSGGLGDGDASMLQTRFSSGGPSQPCGPAVAIPSWGMQYPLNVAWNPSYNGALGGGGVGNGWTIAMPRTDGIADGTNTIQGVRVYDPTAGQWTTPDSFPGNVHDPMTQKSYMWNDKNPVSYQDPSGYTTYIGNAWIKGVDLLVNLHAFVQVSEGRISEVFEYGPSTDNSSPLVSKDYGTTRDSPHKGPIAILSSVHGVSGTELDNRVLSVFLEVSRFLSTSTICYCEANSNVAIAAGLSMLGLSYSEISKLVLGPGAGFGDAAKQGAQLAKMITHSAQNAQASLGLMGSNGLDYCDSCQESGVLQY
jgi:YD repeat-containing protein